MGVPKFYRWLSERYPLINKVISDSSMLPEVDNFYLDMNGIIHNCSHPNDNAASNQLTEREIMLGIFRYINRCVSEIVKPKKVLFMAIDGVAPRAKMNQQRSRRFRAAQEREENIQKAKQAGEVVDEDTLFDSNCITPGTAFMDRVGKHIRYFIRKKVKEDPLWQNLEIVFSGHDVPGEGEHKIMQYIRDARARPGYSPNTRHCMYGQDADLIMLGLATHEPHFILLREVIDFGSGRNFGGSRSVVIQQTEEAKFQLLHLSVLREYIEVDLAIGCSSELDIERLCDDFIFLTFLVGNDFLPHLPTLDIGEQAFDVIFSAYRNLLRQSPGYIVENGEIGDMHRFELLCQIIGQQEVEILENRAEDVASQAARNSRRCGRGPVGPSLEEMEEAEEAAAAAYADALNEAQGTGAADVTAMSEQGQKDFHGRYYFEKFRVIVGSSKGMELMSSLQKSYLEGLAWCLAYYCKGCISWTWYFPYHYGPMLRDLKNLTPLYATIKFELGAPFLPFQQLLGCLPPLSAKLLPRPYQKIMLDETQSPVIEFYPREFKIDMNGKKAPWEAVVILPFIDEVRLMAAEKMLCPSSKLTDEEKKRNSIGLVCNIRYDPQVLETYYSCNPEIGLADIHKCNSRANFTPEKFTPGTVFMAKLVPGTTIPYPGYPSLGVIPIAQVFTDAVKMNVFGSDSRYQSVILEAVPQSFDVSTLDLGALIGRAVWVNYPQIHEARITGVETEFGEWRRKSKPRLNSNKAMEVGHIGTGKSAKHKEEAVYDPSADNEIVYNSWDKLEASKWRDWSRAEESAYKTGRGVPGTGGVDIGPVQVKLRVRVLQGMARDAVTGATKKVFGQDEAEIPIQVSLWECPCPDPRFTEVESAPVSELMPEDCEVIAVAGPVRGMIGRVRHSPASLQKDAPRAVDVEFTMLPQEPPFGHNIAQQVADEYFSGKDLANALGINTSVLGKVVGAIFLEESRMDLGLNLKRTGQYCMNGYSRLREVDATGAPIKVGVQMSSWDKQDSVQVVGSTPKVAAEETGFWEYTAKTAALIAEYKAKFPTLFSQLAHLPHSHKYKAKELFPYETNKTLEAVQEWLSSQPFYSKARTPLTSITLSALAVQAIERAADVRRSALIADEEANGGPKKVIARKVPLEYLFRGGQFTSTDAPLVYNDGLHPMLGDRVVNLTSTGVPFGIRGTVVTIHKHTKYVEVVFDEEFIGGKALAGLCSPFRGRLVPWSGVLCLSTPEEQGLNATAVKKQKKASKATNMLAATTAHVASITLEEVPKPSKTAALGDALKKTLKIGENKTSEVDRPQEQDGTVEEPVLKSDGTGLKALLAAMDADGDDDDDDVGNDFESSHLLRSAARPMPPPIAHTMPPPPPEMMMMMMQQHGMPPAPPNAEESEGAPGATEFPSLSADGPEVPEPKLGATSRVSTEEGNHRQSRDKVTYPKKTYEGGKTASGQTGSLRSKFRPKDPTKPAPKKSDAATSEGAKKVPKKAAAAPSKAKKAVEGENGTDKKKEAMTTSEAKAKAKSDALKALLMKKVDALKGGKKDKGGDASASSAAPASTGGEGEAGTETKKKSTSPAETTATAPKAKPKPKGRPEPKPEAKPQDPAEVEKKVRALVPSLVKRRKVPTPSKAAD